MGISIWNTSNCVWTFLDKLSLLFFFPSNCANSADALGPDCSIPVGFLVHQPYVGHQVPETEEEGENAR